MAPMGVACQAMPRWLTTPLAASPASFQPSNPAMATGLVSSPMSLNSMTRHLPDTAQALLTAYVVGPPRWVNGRVSAAVWEILATVPRIARLGLGGNEYTTIRPCRASRGGRRGNGHYAPGKQR